MFKKKTAPKQVDFLKQSLTLIAIVFSFFFFIFGHIHSIWKFWAKGSNPSWSWSNPGSLIHCAQPGIKRSFQRSQEITDPTATQWQLPFRVTFDEMFWASLVLSFSRARFFSKFKLASLQSFIILAFMFRYMIHLH